MIYLTTKFHDLTGSPEFLKRAERLTGLDLKASASGGKKGRVRTGLASVFGNIDAVSDIVEHTAFDDAIADFSKGIRPRLMYNHDLKGLPIGSVTAMRKIGTSELPDSVRNAGGTGALLVVKQYFKSAAAEAILEAVDAGEMSMSFGFDIIDDEYVERDGKRVRLLKKLRLWEVSDTPFPANRLATATISKHWPPRTGSKLTPDMIRLMKLRAAALSIGLPK